MSGSMCILLVVVGLTMMVVGGYLFIQQLAKMVCQ